MWAREEVVVNNGAGRSSHDSRLGTADRCWVWASAPRAFSTPQAAHWLIAPLTCKLNPPSLVSLLRPHAMRA